MSRCRAKYFSYPYLLHPGVDLLVRGVDQEVALLVLLDECFHPEEEEF